MRSVADELRADTARRVLEMTPAARVELAMRLGDDDVALLCAARNLSEVDARMTIRRARQAGRQPSAAARP